jgi:hypothetical protein
MFARRPEVAMRRPAPDLIVIDTLGKLAAHGHGVGGCCRACRRLFSVSMPALIRERGADSPVVGMKPLPCPVCGGHLTNLTIMVPSKGRG